MARRRPQRTPHVPLRSAALTTRESGPDGEWYVRTISGSSAVKDYRCPGCDQIVARGTPHVVAWPAGEYGSLDDRRHWHTSCWQARYRRRPERR
ncbi:hypothetical protein SAMN05443637_103282 [Pseudonocardia thermophila]|jgi:hypothetical protein|uniref:ATP/GTP-binding protein n=1 Tax=Pseudonocardia thermophila TaxID=1848 RepID=A0A1M6QF95_PSETH|nr:hypothetical protein [Pseudonocardia thermophila]SHK18780.1 hypothetical protein SAMN05443637_103282 [Pseudonocardia thermophila]